MYWKNAFGQSVMERPSSRWPLVMQGIHSSVPWAMSGAPTVRQAMSPATAAADLLEVQNARMVGKHRSS